MNYNHYMHKQVASLKAAPGMTDHLRLVACMMLSGSNVEVCHEQTEARREFLRQVQDFAEDGKIAIVTNGMDCDCASWENRVSLVNATVVEVDRWLADYYGGAEGPQGHYLEFPSIARDLRVSHRDLALEAFEDGHPHSVHY